MVAIKEIHTLRSPTRLKRLFREMRILRDMQHPGVMTLLDAFEPSNPDHLGDFYLVFDLMDGDLKDLIKSDHVLSLEQISFIAYQLLEGLSYMHRANVIHRDLKPENILILYDDCVIKIADFGLARTVCEGVDSQPITNQSESQPSCGDEENREASELDQSG